MSRIYYTITSEDSEKIRERMKSCKNKTALKKMESVALRGEGYTNCEVGRIKNYSSDYVSRLVSIYCNQGLEVIAEDGRKGGNHRNLTLEQEAEIINSFRELAAKGQIITVAEIRKKYDEKLGRESHPNYIYTVLKRHKWRQVMPRGAHPKKASDEVIEASKKLTQNLMKSGCS